MRLSQPTVGAEELARISGVLASGFMTQGPEAKSFEERVADYVGTEYAFATSSCTTALHLTLTALGVAGGDEVIVSDFTFPASANAVIQTGATPVFADIDPVRLTATADTIAARITPRTRAIMIVHAFGLCADMGPIQELADATGLPLVEDAATALGSEYQGIRAGALGRVACFSFHPRKIITTGEGGMITTGDPELASRIQLLRSHGAERGPHYLTFLDAGFNYRLSDVNAAIGLAQMDRLAGIVDSRRALAARYEEALGPVGLVATPTEPAGTHHTYQSYVCRLDDTVDRDSAIQLLSAKGIESTLGTYALHCQPAYFGYGYQPGDLPGSYRAFRQTLTLPLHSAMTPEDVGTVATAVKDAVEASRRGAA